jgi:hypothetical protein
VCHTPHEPYRRRRLLFINDATLLSVSHHTQQFLRFFRGDDPSWFDQFGRKLWSSKSRAMVWMTVSPSYPVPMNCAKWNGGDDEDDDADDDTAGGTWLYCKQRSV